MACGYMRPDPKEAFRNTIRYYRELIDIAVREGYTEEQAIELLKVWMLAGIESNVEQIG